ncbi:MAG: hypothetical protein LUH03_06870 [Oscillospiraceae bacterium]|nr:hypothetical protein [Oscillospiraceae bacterium]
MKNYNVKKALTKLLVVFAIAAIITTSVGSATRATDFIPSTLPTYNDIYEACDSKGEEGENYNSVQNDEPVVDGSLVF